MSCLVRFINSRFYVDFIKYKVHTNIAFVEAYMSATSRTCKKRTFDELDPISYAADCEIESICTGLPLTHLEKVLLDTLTNTKNTLKATQKHLNAKTAICQRLQLSLQIAQDLNQEVYIYPKSFVSLFCELLLFTKMTFSSFTHALNSSKRPKHYRLTTM